MHAAVDDLSADLHRSGLSVRRADSAVHTAAWRFCKVQVPLQCAKADRHGDAGGGTACLAAACPVLPVSGAVCGRDQRHYRGICGRKF